MTSCWKCFIFSSKLSTVKWSRNNGIYGALYIVPSTNVIFYCRLFVVWYWLHLWTFKLIVWMMNDRYLCFPNLSVLLKLMRLHLYITLNKRNVLIFFFIIQSNFFYRQYTTTSVLKKKKKLIVSVVASQFFSFRFFSGYIQKLPLYCLRIIHQNVF